MHQVNVSDEDYEYLLLYSDAFGVSVDQIIARRIAILRSATAAGYSLACQYVDANDDAALLRVVNYSPEAKRKIEIQTSPNLDLALN